MSSLAVRHLRKSFRSREVVRDVSVEVRDGEIVSLLGPNGAGKTTCFHMIIGLTPCGQGTIHLNGEEISDLPMHKRARLGLSYLPQEESIFRGLTVEENILAILEAQPKLSPDDRQERLEELLRQFDIERLRHHLGHTLSGGERRRTEIARSLATAPLFLLLDEPFAGIDPISVQEMQRLIQELRRYGLGVLITDHNVHDTLALCDRNYIVHDGTILLEGSADEIRQNEQARRLYLGESFGNPLETLQKSS